MLHWRRFIAFNCLAAFEHIIFIFSLNSRRSSSVTPRFSVGLRGLITLYTSKDRKFQKFEICCSIEDYIAYEFQ